VRLLYGRKTFAYVNVRADHLRIDLPLEAADAGSLRGNVRVRDVQATNPWKVSLYVERKLTPRELTEALRYVHGLLQDGRL
jgi:hypothetical protein